TIVLLDRILLYFPFFNVDAMVMCFFYLFSFRSYAPITTTNSGSNYYAANKTLPELTLSNVRLQSFIIIFG
ncbi:hypothetical protein KKF45_05605, partial [Patescibacteria group bacterium]|nr:hypothetical protein [Patescibacteria group bacterium]